MSNIKKMFSSSQNFLGYADQYYNYLAELFKNVDRAPINQFVEAILDCRRDGRKIFLIGNGGSAATATHFANDLLVGPRLRTNGIKAISLCDNLSVITAIGNDMGYNEIFTRQLEVLAAPGDLLVAFSASGNSPNIVNSLNYAKKNNLKIVGISGFDGGELKKMSDIKIHLETPKGEYAPVEDFHMTIVHLVGSYIRFWAENK